jgi:crotonobetainyl-CoA:carnitine CoA-transferase CaiB-like acyl-CoA transferase
MSEAGRYTACGLSNWRAWGQSPSPACCSAISAPGHPHNAARQTFTGSDGYPQAAPAPRFSATPAGPPRPAAARGEQTAEVLAEWLGLHAGTKE